ncbi:MAG TPA: hypothetical protein VEB21_12220, partial [Terriglobales bacterium]|nr:hypothetical protein [Terriglobales bacterium]
MSYARLTQLEPRDGLAGIGERLRQEITTSGGGESQLDAAAAALLAAADLPGSRLEQAWRESRGALLRLLARLVVHAPFLAPVLAAQPQWLLDLTGDDLARPRGAETYRAELEEELAASSETQAPQILRRFKYRSLVRITARELSPELIPDSREPEVLAEISALADVLLQAALRLADQRTRERFGLPAGSGEVAEFVILGLGKLGAAELNYSSDVDLVYVFEAAGGGTLAEKVAPVEYYTRLAQELGRIVAAQGPDGFLYRVDLELRPEGKQGALVIADSAFLQYYDTWAATWEKAAAMKARPVAGDLAFGWRLIRSLGPMLYRTSVDYDSIAAITDLKNLTAAAYTDPDAFDIKRGSGGIRDVETIAQALQLVHGGQIPQVRRRGTEAALQGLAEVGVLQRGDADALLAAYRFLRRLEHRVQMIGERQTHSFPAAPEERAQLGRSLGYHKDPAVQLEQALAQHRATVEELLRRLFPEDTADRIMGFFASRIPDLLAHSAGRDAMQELAAHFAREIEGGPNPQRGLNNLERFTAGIGHRRFYYELLLDRPELVPRLATLFATSEHLSSYLATYPRLIEPIFEDPTVLLLDRPQLEANFAALSRQLAAEHGGSDSETQLDTLRLFHHRELVNVGLLDIVGEVSRREAETALTDIAEVCLDHALALAHEQLAQRPVP